MQRPVGRQEDHALIAHLPPERGKQQVVQPAQLLLVQRAWVTVRVIRRAGASVLMVEAYNTVDPAELECLV